MDKHIQPRIENDLLRVVVNIFGKEKIELKQIGRIKGIRKAVTIRDKISCTTQINYQKFYLRSFKSYLKPIDIKS
jgi:hypothetical protein